MENKNLPDLFYNNFWGDRVLELSRMLGDWLGMGGGNPVIDLRENGNELILEVFVPDFDPRDLDITVNGNMVSLKGDSRVEETRDEQGYFWSSRSRHSFYQEIPLPVWVRSEQTVAGFKDGVLELKMIKGQSGVRGFKPLVEPGNRPLKK